MKLYVDNSFISQAFSAVPPASVNLVIGGAVPQNTYWFDGSADDVRIYSRALSAEEITQLYNQGSATKQTSTKTPTGLESGLVGHWTFDGPDMLTNVADISGQGNHGALQGQTSTTTVIGTIGQALDFDGVDDGIDIGNISAAGSDFDLQDYTSSMWIYKTATPGSVQALVSRFTSAGDPDAVFHNTILNNDSLRFYFHDINYTGALYDSSDTVGNNEWHHIVYLRDNTNKRVTFYIDGVQDSGGWQTYIDSAVASSNNPLRLGESASGSQFFDGKLDDVRIYNRALSADEITQLYNLGR